MKYKNLDEEMQKDAENFVDEMVNKWDKNNILPSIKDIVYEVLLSAEKGMTDKGALKYSQTLRKEFKKRLDSNPNRNPLI